jgi:regulator of replication initiation timing
MTENLLQKLEEKMMTLLTEVEDLRHEVVRLSQENATAKLERQHHAKKLQDLISLLDTVSAPDQVAANVNLVAVESAAG